MADTSSNNTKIDLAASEWRRTKYPQAIYRWGGMVLALAFLSYSIVYLNIPLERFFGMFGRVGALVSDRYYPPDIEYVLDKGYLATVFDTIQMAYLGALFGMLMALPLGWFGSYNMTPNRRFIYPAARFLTMGTRAVHETILTESL